MTDFTDPIFNNEDAARAHLEAIRWPHGPNCPHCGNADPSTIAKIEGKKKTHRTGLFYCNECKGQFTVTVGSVMEKSKVPLHKWVFAFHLFAASKKGMSAHQLHRMIGVTYKTAWFMAHRIREAMAPSPKDKGPLGGEGKTVEADTTYVGGKEKNKHLSKRNARNIGGMGKQVVHVLVERGGRAKSDHIANVTGKTLRPILVKQVDRKSTLMTDEHGGYYHVGKEFSRHEKVDHGAKEYVRGDAYSNTAEGYFAILKRGIIGVYHHVSEAHLKRYLAEFDFRYNYRASLKFSDRERAEHALRGAIGKRLTYHQAGEACYG